MTPYEFMVHTRPENVPAQRAAAFLEALSALCNEHGVMFDAEYSDLTVLRVLPPELVVKYEPDHQGAPSESGDVYALKPLLNGERW